MSDLNLFLAEANEDFKLVKVVFQTSAKQYTYKTVLEVEVGSKAVVDAPSGLTVVEVVEVVPAMEAALSGSLKWLVSVINFDHYDTCVEMEKQATKTLNQLKYTRKRRELLEELNRSIGEEGVAAVRQLIKL